MELNIYQERAMTTCMPSSQNFHYMMLNLVGEVGEFSSKIAKGIRKGQMVSECGDLMIKTELMPQIHEELKKEAGDILWQLAGLCSVMGWELEDVAQMNLDKLASRKTRGVIDGNGDNR